ncbi:hypothetical protein [Thermococcus nautili]|uniref:Uncharacterized protein n=1 Tax=Thermococcus nautili TaxID=195522 RepID=W8P0C2_9EURY|nr:hypothetical protein [Thermococcus nautili]AHL22171.1 hypothetical protein BD01_0546 [Thermococcus nautili]
MKVTVWAKGRWRKVHFNVPDELWKRIEETCRRNGFRAEEALRIILLDGYLDEEVDEEELARLEEEIKGLEERLYELEGHWSPLKFRTYYSALDNQNLAITLSGLIAENRRLRKMLGLEERDFSKVEELIHYYLSYAFGNKNGPGRKPKDFKGS